MGGFLFTVCALVDMHEKEVIVADGALVPPCILGQQSGR